MRFTEQRTAVRRVSQYLNSLHKLKIIPEKKKRFGLHLKPHEDDETLLDCGFQRLVTLT